MKMKETIMRKLLLWLLVAVLFSGGVFSVLMVYMQKLTDRAADELGSLYMSEMMYQMQDHFASIVEIKTEEVRHIANHAGNMESGELQRLIQDTASQLGFEYVALYDEKGNYDTILGEAAWYRGINTFIANVLEGKTVATTGYLTDGGGKYIVFGVPASHKMYSGGDSAVMLAGFSVERLYDYIDLDEKERWSSNSAVWIVLTNGSYVLRYDDIDETSFFDHIRRIGSFVGTDFDSGVAHIEKAMAGGSSFSSMVSVDGEQFHFYGAPTQEPGDWYFVLSMPKGAPDAAIDFHSTSSVTAFMIACVIILLLFFLVFYMYFRLSKQQLMETEQARADAETANRAKSTFLFNASHDIRTPMNAIRGFARIIADHPEDTELVRRSVDKINHSGDTLMQLLNDVLELSRIESGKVKLEQKPLDLYRMMENMQTMFQQDMQEAGLQFHVEPKLTDSVVLCDSLKLTQILMNLLSNSKKFTPAGGSVICGVEQLSLQDGVGEYRFYVNDTGIGMSKEFQQRAFEQFERERTSTVSGKPGSGLGLSIIKRIVEQMEGTYSMESELGEGTKFDVFLRLPLAELPAEEEESQKMKKVELRGRHVLLVEDNDFNREITRYILESLGVEVEEACDGAEALKILTERTSDTFDFVLMDIQMPIMDGFTATEKIRKLDDPVLAAIPIVALTANAFSEDRERCLAAGMNAHLCKPVEEDKLYEVVVELLP